MKIIRGNKDNKDNEKFDDDFQRMTKNLFYYKLSKKKIFTFLLILNFIFMGVLVSYKLLRDNPKILLNQAGYYPSQEKVFLLQTDYLYFHGNFDVISVEDNSIVLNNQSLDYMGYLWGHHYYSGNFSDVINEGIYLIRINIGNFKLTSSPVKINTHIYDKALISLYEFFYYQRCGCDVYEIVPGYVGHKACHLDDGVMYNGKWLNLTGGWHSAGDYAKHNYWGLHIHGAIYSMESAYEKAYDIYNNVDIYSENGKMVPDNVPDILDEILWGLDYVNKTFLDNGTMLGSIVGDLKFIKPSEDTDNIQGDADDRHLFYDENHQLATPYEAMWASAGFAKFINIINGSNSLKYKNAVQPLKENILKERIYSIYNTALNIYNNYSKYFNYSSLLEDSGNNSGLDQVDLSGYVAFMEASSELYKMTNNSAYADNATAIFNILVDHFNPIVIYPADTLGVKDAVFSSILKWAIENGTSPAINKAESLIEPYYEYYWDNLVNSNEDIFHIEKIYSKDPLTGELAPHYFMGANLGLNSLYLSTSEAAFLSYNLTGDRKYLNLGFDQLNWILGKNPFDICMIESIGSVNPPAYHHRYSLISGNMRGAVPGAIPNGIISKENLHDIPYFDMTQSWFLGSIGDNHINYRSNEPWLPHNVRALQTIPLIRIMGL
ncbi:MAG: glycoside hydrolase family 9 protein [Promethearchaeota archaeon]